MSAPNFHFINCLYAIADEDCEGMDKILNHLRYTLTKAFGERFDLSDDRTPHSSRNYPEATPGSILVHSSVKAEYLLIPVVRAGYYSGYNLDYHLVERTDYDEYWNEEAEFSKTAQRKLAPALRKLFKIYDRYATKLRHIGTASNGESFYEVIDKQ
jgi:hypothetical protein